MHSQEEKKKLPSDKEENQENESGEDPDKKPKQEIEAEQEAKLRSRYPGLKPGGGSFLAQKRLSRGQKYFDSGDYNMAKQGGGPSAFKSVPGKFLPPGPTVGGAIPTPESLPPRKPSLIQSKLASGNLS